MWSLFEEELARINARLEASSEHDIRICSEESRDVSELLLNVPEKFPNIKHWLDMTLIKSKQLDRFSW
jgi:hypothetical protein